MNVDNHDLPLVISYWWQQRDFRSLRTLREVPSLPGLLGSMCLHTAGLWGKDVEDQESDCSWVMTVGRWGGSKGAWAVHHWINLEVETKGYLCVLTWTRRPSEPPSLSAKHKEIAFLVYRSDVLEKQKSPKRGEGLWGLSPTQALFSLNVLRFLALHHVHTPVKVEGVPPHSPFWLPIGHLFFQQLHWPPSWGGWSHAPPLCSSGIYLNTDKAPSGRPHFPTFCLKTLSPLPQPFILN